MPNVGTISGSMYLDPSAYITGLNQAAESTRMFQAGVERVSFAGFHRGIFATTTLLYGLNRIMSSMSQGMEEYTNMLGRIGSVADMTAASVEALADSMKKLSVTQGVSRTDIMGGMYTAAQSGFSSPAEMRAMATSGALLSRASGKEIDVKKSVDLMSVARQALGIGQGAITSNRMTDLLLKGRDVGRWELDEMAQALGIPLTVYGNQFASKIGGEETLRQLVAIMSTATLAGLNPRMAAIGTRRLVERTVQLNKTKLGDPLRQALRGAGFSGGDPISAALDQGPIAYLNTLQGITGGSTNELNRLGYGSRDLMVLTSALRGNGQTLNQLYSDLSYGNAAGTTERYSRKMQGTYDFARDRLRAQWEITSQEFMQAAIPLISRFADMLGTFNDVAQALPSSLKSFAMLLAALTSFRLALNFLGVRGSLTGALIGDDAAMAAAGVGGKAATKSGAAKSQSRAAAAARGYGFGGTLVPISKPKLADLYRGDTKGRFLGTPRGFEQYSLSDLREYRPSIEFGLDYAASQRLRSEAMARTAMYGASVIPSWTMRTRRLPIAPKGFGGRPAFKSTGYHYPLGQYGSGMGLGSASASALGMGLGATIGNRIEGEDGTGILPTVLGAVGGQAGYNIVSRFMEAGNSKPGAMRAMMKRFGTSLRTYGPAAVGAAALTRMFDMAEWDKNTPMNYGAEADLRERENLRGRSTNPVLRMLGNAWNSLSAIGMNAAELPTAGGFGTPKSDTWGSNWFGRIWDVKGRSRRNMFDEYGWNGLDKVSRNYLSKNNMMDVDKILGNESFRDYVTKNYGKETLSNLNSDDFRISQPQKWLDLLTDSIKGLARSSEIAKVKTDALADAERERTANMKVADRNIRPYIGFNAGLDTMFALEGSQREPFQAKMGADWNKKYEAALGIYKGDYGVSRFADADLTGRNSELDRMFGGNAPTKVTGVFDENLKWNARLRGMDFLAQNGRSLADPGRVSDDAIIKGLGLDASAMGPEITKSVLGKIRGLDYTDWTKTTMQQKAPFSNSLLYGSKEGYNATLERKDNFAVEIMAPKLGAIVDAIKATSQNTEELQKDYESRLKTTIENATDAIVNAINNLDVGSSGFPSTAD